MPRRRFLKGGAGVGALAALGAAGAGSGLLAGCASDLTGSGTLPLPLPRPGNPVKWPVFAGNTAIKPGLAAERDATLQIYIWEAYINQDVVNGFAKKYKCKAQVTTFNTMNEALSKLRSGLTFDVLVGATPDVLGQLIEGKLAQPLNHSYIPNIIYSTQHGGNGGPALNALGSIMLAMSLVIVIHGYAGYRLLTRGERGSGLAALTAISGEA